MVIDDDMRRGSPPNKATDVGQNGEGKGKRDGGGESWDAGRERGDADRERSRELGNRVRRRDGSESEGSRDLGEHLCSTR